jgi:hypothetical protein
MLTRWAFPVVLILAIIGLVWLVLAPVLELNYEVPSEPADFAPVVAAVLSGQLRPDKDDTVVLPRAYSSLTKTGLSIVERKKNGQVLIFFPTWDPVREGKRGYLFHSRPVSKADILYRHPGSWIVGIAHGEVDHQRFHSLLKVDRKVSRHWYYVRTPLAPPRD